MRVVHAAYPDNDPGDEPYNRYGAFNEYHRNKLSLTLDLTAEECKEIFRKLVLISDVVLENYSARVMRNFGFDYASLRKLNPSIIMVSMPGFRDVRAAGALRELRERYRAECGDYAFDGV